MKAFSYSPNSKTAGAGILWLIILIVAAISFAGDLQAAAAGGGSALAAGGHEAGAAVEDAHGPPPYHTGEPSFLRQVGFSYLVAYMFFLSLCLGSLFLVIIHHLFDASWSVPVRRINEHIAALLFPWMAILFIPIALLAPTIYIWMGMSPPDHALHAKDAYLNPVFFYLRAIIYFAIWGWLTHRLRYFSLQQDKDGAAVWTRQMRKFAGFGIFLFALTLTGASIDWMKSLQHAWFSTMYGVYYFAGSVWTTLATLYFITFMLVRRGTLKNVIFNRQYLDIGVLMLAFTVFYAYIHFSQYFIIWNANIPEETFWYVLRERGGWWDMGMLLVFGHFALPFLLLLRIDAKVTPWLMLPLCAWAWLMHFVDMTYNIMPVLHVDSFHPSILSLLFLAVIGGVLFFAFWKNLGASPAYPIKDPRLKEALTQHVIPPPSPISVSTEGEG